MKSETFFSYFQGVRDNMSIYLVNEKLNNTNYLQTIGIKYNTYTKAGTIMFTNKLYEI